MQLSEIKQTAIELMDAVKARGLAEFSLDADDFKIKIKTNAPAQVAYAPADVSQQPQTANAQPAVAEEEVAGTKVSAPLVGTFYIAPSPDEPPYVEVGQNVKKGDTLFIIEAMKTMNEITAPCDGAVSRILAQSGDMVEYGQSLVVIA